MEPRKVLQDLEDLADRLGVEIVYEKLREEEFSVKGGLCKVKGAYKIFMDRSDPTERRIEILARALACFDTQQVYLLPFIREILEKVQKTMDFP
jgi:hypothetical protein